MTASAPYTAEENALLIQLAADGVPTKDIAARFPERTYTSIRSRLRTLRETGLLVSKRKRPPEIMHAHDGWTDKEIAMLRKLWPGAAMSAATIGARMGKSKSAIIAKARRLNLPGRASPIKPRSEPKPPPPMRRNTLPALRSGAKAQPDEITRMLREVVRRPAPVGPARGSCCWPFGDPKLPGFRFCGAPAVRKSYCVAHAKMAYRSAE